MEPSGAVSGEAAPATKHSEYHNTQMFPFPVSITFNRLHIKEFEMPQNTPRITHMFPVDPSVSSFHNFSRISISRHILEILTCKKNTPYFTTLTYYQVCSMSRILTLLAMPRDFHSGQHVKNGSCPILPSSSLSLSVSRVLPFHLPCYPHTKCNVQVCKGAVQFNLQLPVHSIASVSHTPSAMYKCALQHIIGSQHSAICNFHFILLQVCSAVHFVQFSERYIAMSNVHLADCIAM